MVTLTMAGCDCKLASLTVKVKEVNGVPLAFDAGTKTTRLLLRVFGRAAVVMGLDLIPPEVSKRVPNEGRVWMTYVKGSASGSVPESVMARSASSGPLGD
jgi:hypothetical protein